MKILKKSFALLIVTALFSSCANMYINSGNQAYKEYMYQDAINSLEKGLKKKEGKTLEGNSVLGLRNLAESYLIINKFDEAKVTYDKLISLPNASDRDRLNYGKALMSNAMYTEAEVVLSKVNFASDSGKEAKILAKSCKNVNAMYQDSALYQISDIFLLETTNAFAPVQANDGIYFTTTEKSANKDPYTNSPYTDLFFVKNNGDTWSLPRKVAGVNGKYHDGVPTFGNKDSLMIFTRSNYIGLRSLGANDKHINTMQLYQSTMKKDGTWKEPQPLGINNDNYMLAHPTLSEDGNTLYFSSDRQDSKGGMDLYKSEKLNGKWGTPQNMGNNVNTIGNEVFPVLSGADTLYFSSDAHQTLGGLDIVYSVNRDGNWSKPNHLSYPINSPADDFGMVKVDGENGYFSSDRSKVDQIYSYVYSNPSVSIDWLIVDTDSSTPVSGALVRIKNLTDGTMETVSSNDKGELKHDLLAGKEYEIVVESKDYFTHSEKLSTSGYTEDTVLTGSVNMKPLLSTAGTGGQNGTGGQDGTGGQGGTNGQEGSGLDPNSSIGISGDGSYIIPNILWDYNESVVRSDAVPYLNDLVSLLKDNTNLKVQIDSHCDNRGSNGYNNKLSEKRANSVKEYLISKGVPKSMLTSKGYGKKKLIHKCGKGCSEAQHQENRRTEFSIKK